MKAVHEPDVRERQARGAPEAHGARPDRHAFADHETRPRPVAHAQVGRALVRDTSPGKRLLRPRPLWRTPLRRRPPTTRKP